MSRHLIIWLVCGLFPQRLDTLQQSLQRHIKAEEIDIQNQKQFREKTKSLLDWLEEVKDTLNIEEPNRSSDEHTIKDRMDRLKVNNMSMILSQ